MTSLPLDGPDTDGLGVDEVEIRLVALRLRHPHVASHGTVGDRPTVLVRVRIGEVDGWGECPALPRPTYTAEYAAGAFALLRDVLAPGLLTLRDQAGQASEELVGHRMAHAAVADALLDAALRIDGRSLASALGATRTSVVSRSVVAAAGVEDLVARIADEVAGGTTFVGIKAPADDPYEAVAAVRSSFPDVGLSIDGNGRLGRVDDATWRRLDRLGLDEVEQPCAPGDWLGSARVAGCLGCPVVLDESITGAADIRMAVVLGAGRVVNLKPARVGGLRAAARLARAAAAAGLEVFVGGMLESGVGRAGALALAAALPSERPTHLQPSAAYWERDVTEPLGGAGGRVDVPDGEGIGRAPDAALLDEWTIDRAVCS